MAKLTAFEVELGIAAALLLAVTVWLVRSWQRSSTTVVTA